MTPAMVACTPASWTVNHNRVPNTTYTPTPLTPSVLATTTATMSATEATSIVTLMPLE